MSRLLTALVIGNAAYEGSSKLKNPGNDADDVAVKLEASGFEAVKMIDCANADLDRALKRFKRALVGNDVGLFFFAGHGMQINGTIGGRVTLEGLRELVVKQTVGKRWVHHPNLRAKRRQLEEEIRGRGCA